MQDDVARDNFEAMQAKPFGPVTPENVAAATKTHVQRWTSADARASNAGGFVAYGDYLTLRQENEFQRAQLAGVTAQRDFAHGQVAYWKKRYEQARDALENQEPPPDTINVAMGDLPMEYELYQDQTGTWRRTADKTAYQRHDGQKRAIIVLESK